MQLLNDINNLINFLQNIGKEDDLDLAYRLSKFTKDIPIHHQTIMTGGETVKEGQIVEEEEEEVVKEGDKVKEGDIIEKG